VAAVTAVEETRSSTIGAAPAAAAAALELQDVFKIYREQTVETVALRGAWLTVHPGEFVAVVGPSGSGKSTLLGIAAGLTSPSAGRILVDGRDLIALDETRRAGLRREQIGIVFQRDNLLPFLSALENVEVAMSRTGNVRPGHAAGLLDRVGLADRVHHRPAQLSGGEQQRVAIAAALVNDPLLLLADEPTGELDTATAAGVVDLLFDLNRERGMTVVVVTHNGALARRADRAVRMSDGLLTDVELGGPRKAPEAESPRAFAIPARNTRPVVEAFSIARSYPNGVRALRGVSLAAHSGEMLAITGPSGCGKSTLLNLLGGLDRPTTGTITMAGQVLSDLSARALAVYRRRDIGFVFQAHNLLATLTVAENTELPLIIAGTPEARRRARAAELLECVTMTEHAHKLPDQLSGGQRQRVAIARALANAPKLLLADEPTGSLDSEAAAKVAELLARICHAQEIAVVLVTHDREVAAKSDRVIHLRDGLVVPSGAAP
jgi:putative ABC transport system ATP-binding protein